MKFLRWLGGIVVLLWLIGFVFRFFGAAIHLLLIIAAIAFIADWFTSRKTSKNTR